MSRALIVGCGYLGREVASALAQNGWTVTAWTRSSESAAREGSAVFRVSAVDITDLDLVRKVGEREGPLDWVINCVSSSGGDAEAYRRIYLDGTENLIKGLLFGRILFTSSTSVYGQTDGNLVNEDSPTLTQSSTAQVLQETENRVLARNGLVVRLSGIYGPGRSAMLRRFRSGQATLDALAQGGSRWLNTIHRDDATAGILQLLERSPESSTWNLSDDGGVTQLAAYEFLSGTLGLPLPPMAAPDPNRKRGWSNKRVSNQKMRSMGWQPQYATIIKGLEQELTES